MSKCCSENFLSRNREPLSTVKHGVPRAHGRGLGLARGGESANHLGIIVTVPRSQSIPRAQLGEVADMIGRMLDGVADGSLTAPAGLVSRLEGAESALRIIAGMPSESRPTG
jgi:hypothetical protein